MTNLSLDDVTAEALQIEHDENEEREGCTPSERVAIVKAQRAAIGRKQGERSDLGSNEPKLDGRTNEHLAKAVGLGSRATLERAETVVEHGTTELVQAMEMKAGEFKSDDSDQGDDVTLKRGNQACYLTARIASLTYPHLRVSCTNRLKTRHAE